MTAASKRRAVLSLTAVCEDTPMSSEWREQGRGEFSSQEVLDLT